MQNEWLLLVYLLGRTETVQLRHRACHSRIHRHKISLHLQRRALVLTDLRKYSTATMCRSDVKTMLTLRNYQNRIINEVRRLMSTGRKRICAVAPCGQALARQPYSHIWLTSRRTRATQCGFWYTEKNCSIKPQQHLTALVFSATQFLQAWLPHLQMLLTSTHNSTNHLTSLSLTSATI